MEGLNELRENGSRILAVLREQSEKLPDSTDVQRKSKFAKISLDAVIQVAERLEKLEKERSERLKELAKFRTFQKEVSEVNTFCFNKNLKEIQFEYFHIEKSVPFFIWVHNLFKEKNVSTE